MVDVAHSKNAEFARAFLGADGSSIGSGINIHVQLVHSLHLKYSLRRSRPEKGEVILSRVERQLDAVEGSLDRAKAEVRDESIRNSRLDDSRQRGIGGFDLRAIEIFEAPQFQCRRSEMLETHERLLHEAVSLVGVVIVGGVIAATQSELALGSRKAPRHSEDREWTVALLR